MPFLRARPEHVDRIATRLRASDRSELAVLGIRDPGERIKWILTQPGDARVVINPAGEPVAVFGVMLIAGGAAPWMLCADDVKSGIKTVLRHGHRWARAYRRKFGPLRNAAMARNALHLRFVAWCGFKITADAHVRGEKFQVFEYV